MSEFKAGDKVVEIYTGDVGVIYSKFKNAGVGRTPAWWVDWETGDDAGGRLHIPENEIKLFDAESSKPSEDLAGTEIVIAGVSYILHRK